MIQFSSLNSSPSCTPTNQSEIGNTKTVTVLFLYGIVSGGQVPPSLYVPRLDLVGFGLGLDSDGFVGRLGTGSRFGRICGLTGCLHSDYYLTTQNSVNQDTFK